MQITKRNGTKEDYKVEKIHNILSYATQDIANVSISEIEVNSKLKLYEGISSKEIHAVLVKSAADLITEETPNYQWVAARLLNYSLRKDVWGGIQPPRLYDHIVKLCNSGVYDPEILTYYSEAEIHKIGEIVKHQRDDRYTYSGLQQLVDKYLLKNRETGEVFETPQFIYILISMILFKDYQNRLEYIKRTYDYFSLFKINIPTPIMVGVRTPIRQYASCILTDCGDSLESIFETLAAVGKYTAKRAGIGLNFGRIRPINSQIRSGEVIHTGVIPYLKLFESAVKSTSQNGVRGGGATTNVPFFHYEIEDVLVLKNNSGSDDNRVRKLDYCIQFCDLFYERLIKNEYITLFSPHECPELIDNFGLEQFNELYIKREKDKGLKFRKKILARKLAEVFATERLETGRIYVMNMDNANRHSSWSDRVTMTNLCCEITVPTEPISRNGDGEIGVCVLSALNMLEINDNEMESVCDITVRLLDALIDYQEYVHPAAERFCKNRRSLGIGVTNLAGFLARNKLSYDNCLEVLDEFFEKMQFYLLKSSCELAKEKGKCNKFGGTKYALGLLPLDWRNKNTDSLVARKESMDWAWLREQIKTHGLRHSTLSALMPAESSSLIQNSTNGIEPPRKLVSIKKSKTGTLKQVVPFLKHKNYYQLAFDIRDNKTMLNIAAVAGRWIDMASSVNTYYNYKHYPDGNIPLSVIVKDCIYANKFGVKTLYYANTPDGDNDGQTQQENCVGGACSI